MRPISASTPLLTLALAATYLAAGTAAMPIAERQKGPDRRAAGDTTTATGCLRLGEDAGTYLLTTTSIELPDSSALEPEDAARARPPQRTEVPPPVPGGERAPDSAGAEGERDVPGASDDVLSLRLIFGPSVDARRYVGQRVEVKGELERPDPRQGEADDADAVGIRAGTAGSTETTGQTGSVSATGQTARTSGSAAGMSKPLTFHVASVRMLSPRCEAGR